MKSIALAAGAALFALSATVPAQAFVLTKPALDYKLHIAECFVLMLTDPDRRDAECGSPASLPNEVLSANMGSGVSAPLKPPVDCAPGTTWNWDLKTCDWPN